MNRRYFLQLAGLAGIFLGIGQKLFAGASTETVAELDVHRNKPSPLDLSTHNSVNSIFMVTYQNRHVGFESTPWPVQANEDRYIVLPGEMEWQARARSPHVFKLPKLEQYVIYAPLAGFEQTGPWYFLKTVSLREAKASRFTIAVPEYKTSDLAPVFSPRPVAVELPSSVTGQDYWAARLPNSSHSVAIIKCP